MSEPVVTKTYFITDKEDNEFPEAFVNSTNPRSIEVQCCHFTYDHNTSVRPHWTMHCSFVQSDPYLNKGTITTNETRTKFKTYPYKGCQDTFKIWFSGDDIDKEPEQYVFNEKEFDVPLTDLQISDLYIYPEISLSPTYSIIEAFNGYQMKPPKDGESPLTEEFIDELGQQYSDCLGDFPAHINFLRTIKGFLDQLTVDLSMASGKWIRNLLNYLPLYPDWGYWDQLAKIMVSSKALNIPTSNMNEKIKIPLLILYLQDPDVNLYTFFTNLNEKGVITTDAQSVMFAALDFLLPEAGIRNDLRASQLLAFFPVIYQCLPREWEINSYIDEVLAAPGDSLFEQLLYVMDQRHIPLPEFAKSCKLLYPLFMYMLATIYDPNRVPTVTPKIKTDELVLPAYVTRYTYTWTYTDPAIGTFTVTQQENYYDPNCIPHKFLAEFMLIY